MKELGLRTIPGYIVYELLETDLVSATYLAERESDGYPVVLQIIAEEFDDPGTTAAYYAAYQRVMQIGHPVLPAVWDVGHHDGVLYSVTGAVEGRSLSSALARAGRLSFEATVTICSELADALDTLHAADVVHGAVNPYTIWINDRERVPSAPWVTLRGFGTAGMLARRAGAEQQDQPPTDLLYIAPEQIRRDAVTARVDQYALACMAVHCLTGAPPFERSTVNALVGAHLFAAPSGTDGHWDDLHPHIVAAVQRAMAKDPVDRFALCDGFATAIGGTRQRSWTWMIEDALAQQIDGPQGQDRSTTDDPTGPLPVAVEPNSPPRTNGPPPATGEDDRPSTAAIHDDVTARVFAEVDWLPGGGEPGGTRRIAAPEPLPRFSPEAAKTRRVPGQLVRWVVLVVALLVTITLAVTLISRSTDRTPDANRQDIAEEPETPVAPKARPAWQQTVEAQPITSLLDTGNAIVGSAGDVVSSIDPATGKTRWQAAIDDPVVDVTAVEGVVVARTDGTLYAFDEQSGRGLWNSTDERIAPSAVAAGTTSLYVVAAGRTTMSVHALDPATGEVEWSINDLEATAPQTSAVYDRSRLGERMLYVLNGSRLHAVDTSNHQVRWDTALEQPQIGSLMAAAKAIVVINADGQICRYGMESGDAVWTRCARLGSAPGARAVVRTRNARVLVRSAREIAAVDFTSGASHWRVADRTGFQDPFAANADTAFVAHADGSIEAIDHQRGVERWRSEPLGGITAMAASDDGVYVATADQHLLRFASAATP
jgi:outer membrane protein assembly factor BamB/serine/threonine protein kinase